MTQTNFNVSKDHEYGLAILLLRFKVINAVIDYRPHPTVFRFVGRFETLNEGREALGLPSI